jgi:hypothetical protein
LGGVGGGGGGWGGLGLPLFHPFFLASLASGRLNPNSKGGIDDTAGLVIIIVSWEILRGT